MVSDQLPTIRPVMEQIINENLEATITAKIDEVKERLASLLARNAMDTAVLYLVETRRWSAEERQAWRKAAADHVRGRLAEINADSHATEEITALRRKVEHLAGQLQQKEKSLIGATEQVQGLRNEIDGLHRVLAWRASLLHWLEQEWDRSGILGRRKPFQACVADFEQQAPRPKEA